MAKGARLEQAPHAPPETPHPIQPALSQEAGLVKSPHTGLLPMSGEGGPVGALQKAQRVGGSKGKVFEPGSLSTKSSLPPSPSLPPPPPARSAPHSHQPRDIHLPFASATPCPHLVNSFLRTLPQLGAPLASTRTLADRQGIHHVLTSAHFRRKQTENAYLNLHKETRRIHKKLYRY